MNKTKVLNQNRKALEKPKKSLQNSKGRDYYKDSD